MPAHSSTITFNDTPRNVNVREKLAAFENTLRQGTPLVHLHLNSGDTRRPSSSIRTINVDDDSLQSSNVREMNRNSQVG